MYINFINVSGLYRVRACVRVHNAIYKYEVGTICAALVLYGYVCRRSRDILSLYNDWTIMHTL